MTVIAFPYMPTDSPLSMSQMYMFVMANATVTNVSITPAQYNATDDYNFLLNTSITITFNIAEATAIDQQSKWGGDACNDACTDCTGLTVIASLWPNSSFAANISTFSITVPLTQVGLWNVTLTVTNAFGQLFTGIVANVSCCICEWGRVHRHF
jgi:hypothetical protein